MGSSTPRRTTQTTTSDPWAPLQPYLQRLFQGGENLYSGGGGRPGALNPPWMQQPGGAQPYGGAPTGGFAGGPGGVPQQIPYAPFGGNVPKGQKWKGLREHLDSGGTSAYGGKIPQGPKWGDLRGYLGEGGAGSVGGGGAGGYSPIVPPFNDLQNQAFEQQANWAGGLQDQIDPLNSAARSALDAPNIENNPALEAAMQAATRPFQQQQDLFTRPTIGRNYVGTGDGSTSSRESIEGGVSQGLTNQAMLDTRGRMASDAYGQGLQARSQAMALYPSILQQGRVGTDALANIGAQYRGLQGQYLDEPYEALSRYANILMPGMNAGGSSKGPGPTGPSDQQNNISNGISALMAYAMLTAPSDVRLKTNISKIGNVSGVNIYSWDWKSGGSSKGVIAQEVEQIWPDVVHEIEGVKMVDYATIARRI